MVNAGRLRVLGLAVTCLLGVLAPGAPALAAARAPKAKTRAEATKKTAKPSGKQPGKAASGHQPGKAARAETSAKAGRGTGNRGGGRGATAPASTWLFTKPANVVPNQQGKVVLFGFRNDDSEQISRQVGQLLGSRGLEVMTGVRRVDTTEQFRDVATHLGLVAYVDGDVRGNDAKLKVTVRLRNGYSGRNVSQAVFTESRPNLTREISDKLWTKLGPALARACKDAEKPRKKSRTLQINAGTPIETVPNPPAEDGT
jgi:hypothetical protein